jgi:hypothetical protein
MFKLTKVTPSVQTDVGRITAWAYVIQFRATEIFVMGITQQPEIMPASRTLLGPNLRITRYDLAAWALIAVGCALAWVIHD